MTESAETTKSTTDWRGRATARPGSSPRSGPPANVKSPWRWHTSWLCFLLLSIAAPASAVDVVLVCPDAFQTAARTWVEHRRAESLQITVIPSQRTAESLSQTINQASDANTRYVVLLGDAPVIGTPCDPARQIPTHYRETTVTRNWGSTPTIATDLPYGLAGPDKIPRRAVGRIPVTSPAQVQSFVNRLKAYERSRDFGPWRQRIELTAGVGGFGMIADAAIEQVTRAIVTGVLPGDTRTSIAYGSPGHRFYPPGPSFRDAVIRRYRRGSRFWVYAGHGWIDQLDRVPATEDGIAVLDNVSVSRLAGSQERSSIGLMLACYTGAFDASQPCLAESMMMQPFGPIAMIAGSRVTMPYGNCTAAVGLIDGIYDRRMPRLGDAWLGTLSAMHADDEQDDRTTTRKLIDTLAAVVSPSGTKLIDERHEHMRLYNLLGDPTLKLNPPKTVPIRVVSGHLDGQPLQIEWSSPIDGQSQIDVGFPVGYQPDDQWIDAGWVREVEPGHWSIASADADADAGAVNRHTFELPESIDGMLICRVRVDGSDDWASGSADLVAQPRQR
ncbi:hypothetical protein Pan14r_41480 [Crateriforma conspicua]|uniref:Gingipain domain-containing protein n=1 Tax=Crateriforma conspicua TaxID=2527996 RepID=A0A5C5YBN1_9PLAN|nr:hypothetical protein Pan14r_41480 [Crateriforma conspicua]